MNGMLSLSGCFDSELFFLVDQEQRVYLNRQDISQITIDGEERDDSKSIYLNVKLKSGDKYTMGIYETVEDAQTALSNLFCGDFDATTVHIA